MNNIIRVKPWETAIWYSRLHGVFLVCLVCWSGLRSDYFTAWWRQNAPSKTYWRRHGAATSHTTLLCLNKDCLSLSCGDWVMIWRPGKKTPMLRDIRLRRQHENLTMHQLTATQFFLCCLLKLWLVLQLSHSFSPSPSQQMTWLVELWSGSIVQFHPLMFTLLASFLAYFPLNISFSYYPAFPQ